ncbi:unnamed protein product [Rotaria socialis]|uniref:Uncharacterized protein n=1 Tax=Rotaria socialis TaxID=392032 RepID=A0A818D1J4_9BILA|nr:unnamed protein product [Rotaria socialis]
MSFSTIFYLFDPQNYQPQKLVFAWVFVHIFPCPIPIEYLQQYALASCCLGFLSYYLWCTIHTVETLGVL